MPDISDIFSITVTESDDTPRDDSECVICDMGEYIGPLKNTGRIKDRRDGRVLVVHDSHDSDLAEDHQRMRWHPFENVEKA